MQIKKYNISHKQYETQKSYDDINRWGKRILKDTALIYGKSTQQSGSRGSIPQHNEGHIEKSTANIILNRQKIEAFPVRSGTKKGCQLSLFLLNIILVVVATEISQ